MWLMDARILHSGSKAYDKKDARNPERQDPKFMWSFGALKVALGWQPKPKARQPFTATIPEPSKRGRQQPSGTEIEEQEAFEMYASVYGCIYLTGYRSE